MTDGIKRRDFLKVLGASSAGATMAGCGPSEVEKLLSPLNLKELKARKVKVKRWTESAPSGVTPLVYPPGLRQEAYQQLSNATGPCVLLEF